MYLRAKGDQKADGKGGERDGLRAEAAALFAEEGKMWDGDMRDRLVHPPLETRNPELKTWNPKWGVGYKV